MLRSSVKIKTVIKMDLAFKMIIKHALANTQECLRNTRDLNRTQMMAETKRHQQKYSDPLFHHRDSLAEDLELIIDLKNSTNNSFYRNRIQQKSLDDIFKNWPKSRVAIEPYRRITLALQAIQKQVQSK